MYCVVLLIVTLIQSSSCFLTFLPPQERELAQAELDGKYHLYNQVSVLLTCSEESYPN